MHLIKRTHNITVIPPSRSRWCQLTEPIMPPPNVPIVVVDNRAEGAEIVGGVEGTPGTGDHHCSAGYHGSVGVVTDCVEETEGGD